MSMAMWELNDMKEIFLVYYIYISYEYFYNDVENKRPVGVGWRASYPRIVWIDGVETLHLLFSINHGGQIQT